VRVNGQPPAAPERTTDYTVLAWWLAILVVCLALWALVILGAVCAWGRWA